MPTRPKAPKRLRHTRAVPQAQVGTRVPPAKRPLSLQQAKFCEEYSKDFNGTQAAIRAGYKPKAAASQATDLLRRPNIQAKLQAIADARLTALAEASAKHEGPALTRLLEPRPELTPERVLEEFRRLAFSDVGTLFDDKGNLKSIHELTPEQRSCIGSIEVVLKNTAAGDGVIDVVHKVKLWDKNKALENLAKHFGLLIEMVGVMNAKRNRFNPADVRTMSDEELEAQINEHAFALYGVRDLKQLAAQVVDAQNPEAPRAGE